jgi:diadenosine tetraphosphate (Ap4A) HIT family hydrolase
MTCPFCQIPPERIVAQNAHAFAIRDGFPVSPGHTLIIPKRHVGSFFETTQEEKLALLELLEISRNGLVEKGAAAFSQQPTAFNIGVNDGPAAGQTVPHLHIHLIPRYEGDMPDPRGGVRWVIPEKAKYWE